MSKISSHCLADFAEQFPDYDLELMAARIEQFQPVKRFSQRAEAVRLQPLIARLVRDNPALMTADITSILREGASVNRDQLGPTFDREVGTQVGIAKTIERKRDGGTKKGHRQKAQAANASRTGGSASPAPPLPCAVPPQAVSASPSRSASSLDATAIGDGPSGRPYTFSGNFKGMVFKHTAALRNFFNAVQHERGMGEIRKLADAVLDDPASLDALDRLDVADRAIFDAVAAEIVGGLQQ